MDVIESHGARIPVIGFGTMTLKDNLCVELVEAALHLGYRHLDTAQNYGNEREVGEGVRASGVPREDVFITTKVWFNRLAPGDLERSVDESLERLKLPWVDLLLIHWPNAQIPLAGSIESLCKVKRAGLAKHIGVANFTVAMLDEATFASPGYFEAFGTPRTLDDLDGHHMIGFVSSATGSFLPLEFTVDGVLRQATLSTTVSVTGAETYVAAARLGLGLIQVPRYHAAPDLASGTLVEVLTEYPSPSTPVSLLYPHSRQLSPRVRVFIDWVRTEFTARASPAGAG